MPKKTKPSPRQPSLLPKRPIPQMPAGYYSSGPNPNLRRFVEEHATPYDPTTDRYKAKPFDQPITTTKATAIYNMHTYWSKKPHDAIREYIKHYTRPGDIVLDPFCGSGGTALAALMEGRAAIAIDLSPAATFITKNYCTPVDVDELQRAFEELQRKVKPEMDWLYETRCDRCDGKATIGYVIYSQIFQCPRCLEKVALFDCLEIDSNTAKGDIKKIRVCPFCFANQQIEEIRLTSIKFGVKPVLVSYLCNEGCKPQRSERRHNDTDSKKRDYFEIYDIGKLRELERHNNPHWYPTMDMMNVSEVQKRWGLLWRPYHGDIRHPNDFFTKRNNWGLGKIYEASSGNPCEDTLKFVFSSVLLNVSKMCGPNWTGPMGNTLYVPAIHRELNVWTTTRHKFDQISKGITTIANEINSTDLIISCEDAQNLNSIPPSSIDYIFTDPPYSSTVQFGELNFIWEAWLGLRTDWHDDEIIINSFRGKSEIDWKQMLHRAFQECFRVLKPGRWLSLCYHDTSEGTWQFIQDMMAEIGFMTDVVDKTIYIDAKQKAHKQIVADKVAKRDLVINFRKPRPGELSAQIPLFDASDFSTFQEAARAVLVEALTTHPGSTADRLYDELVSRLVRKGQFERHDFDDLLRSVAEPVSEPRMANLFEKEQPNLFGTHEVVRWYLRATADVLDEAERTKEEAAAARLEAFMGARLGWRTADRARGGGAGGDSAGDDSAGGDSAGVNPDAERAKPGRAVAGRRPSFSQPDALASGAGGAHGGGDSAGDTSAGVNPDAERAKPGRAGTGRRPSLSQPEDLSSGARGTSDVAGMESGVHYSDLFEQYLPIKDKPRRLLQEWLPEYFFKTPEGTWRPPVDEVERAQLAALRSSGLLRRVKRFGNALLEGVPPSERDKPESPATLADWVRQCRRAGLYEIGRTLYEKSGIRFDGLDETARLQVDEDYQICMRRSEAKSATKRNSRQTGLFDDSLDVKL